MRRMEWLAFEFVAACFEQLREVQTTYSDVPDALQDAWEGRILQRALRFFSAFLGVRELSC